MWLGMSAATICTATVNHPPASEARSSTLMRSTALSALGTKKNLGPAVVPPEDKIELLKMERKLVCSAENTGRSVEFSGTDPAAPYAFASNDSHSACNNTGSSLMSMCPACAAALWNSDCKRS